MSLDTVGISRAGSPASSDGFSGASPRVRGRDEDIQKKDKAYRRYAAGVDRALSLFDSALQEWADYISFLSRLLKALQAHPSNISTVPNKVLVSKRLAQCLNPSLPSGVHQKTLEVYAYVFGMLKRDGLAHDLPLYFPGIASTLSFASLSVRPLFLSLLENYIVQIDPVFLRPALKSIILSILPGLEEETSEDFDRTLRILNKFRSLSPLDADADGDMDKTPYFWQCLFLASITNPSRRPGVLAYLTRHLPKIGDATSVSAVQSIVSPEPGLLLRCFATGLLDDQLLVQRSFLDLLVTHLPLSTPVLQTLVTEEDLDLLVSAAANVVTRRDMGLNRRLWTWFLGPEGAGGTNESAPTSPSVTTDGKSDAFAEQMQMSFRSQYFVNYGIKPLVRSITAMIESNSMSPVDRAKPFRISLSLMDRWEVGGPVVPAVFLPILRSVQQYQDMSITKEQFEEVFRSASVFFDGVESGMIWREILRLVHLDLAEIQEKPEKIKGDLELASFIIDNFNVKEEEMLLVHVPVVLLSLLIMVRDLVARIENARPAASTKEVVERSFDILDQLLDLLPERALTATSSASSPSKSWTTAQILSCVEKFYAQSADSLELPSAPFSAAELANLLVLEASRLVLPSLKSGALGADLQERMSMFITLFRKAPRTAALHDGQLKKAMFKRLQDGSASSVIPFAALSAIIAGSNALYSKQPIGEYLSYEDICDLIPLVIRQMWPYFSASCPKYHVEAFRCLVHLQAISSHDRAVEAAITALMISPSSENPSHSVPAIEAEKFMVIWGHSEQSSNNIHDQLVRRASEKNITPEKRSKNSAMLERPLFLTLDALFSQSTSSYHLVKLWLQDLPSIGKILALILSRVTSLCPHDSNAELRELSEIKYYFETVRNILSVLVDDDWSRLTNAGISTTELVSRSDERQQTGIANLHVALMHTCQAVLERLSSKVTSKGHATSARLTVLSVMGQLITGKHAEDYLHSDLEAFLIDRLWHTLDFDDDALQIALIDTLHSVLKLRYRITVASHAARQHGRSNSIDALAGVVRGSISGDRGERDSQAPRYQPPVDLMKCLLKGLKSPKARNLIEKWISLLCESLALHSETIFQLLISIVGSLCEQINLSFEELKQTFQNTEFPTHQNAERVAISLLTGLEHTLAEAHGKLLVDEAIRSPSKSPEQPQGFFGNMVSGVFAIEGPQARTATANSRLTVLLCFNDAVNICYSIWSWGNRSKDSLQQDEASLASFQYTSLRLRNRARRILENLFAAEELECMETLIRRWVDSSASGPTADSRVVISLLHTLEGSRPKRAVPAIFNAIYSRTNPMVLDAAHKSSLTSELSDIELASFLVTYAKSLDDDVLDEIWSDCTSFLRDVLGNPLPHRQILGRLLQFTAIIGEKMENTNFGEERRMKKELSELLLRLLTAIFTIKPSGGSQDTATPLEQAGDETLAILATTFPALTSILGESDRAAGAMSAISGNLLGPLIRSRHFPQNFNEDALELMKQMSKIAGAAKTWKRDMNDAFNDPRFFSAPLALVKSHWLLLLRQWTLIDKDRLPELFTRLAPPTTAGIMFGVGASAARLEADRKTQLNLRRISMILLSAEVDNFASNLPVLQEKLCDLMSATNVTSPSSATRAEIFMVLRSIVLTTSSIHLAGLWPIIDSELQEAISSISFDRSPETYSPFAVLQACKLLDTLLLIAPDDFQLHEWLFITDTADAVYRQGNFEPLALIDEVSQSLGQRKGSITTLNNSGDTRKCLKRPMLIHERIQNPAKEDIVDKVLRPFFAELSIHAFESTYSLGAPDIEACRDELLADLLEEGTMAI